MKIYAVLFVLLTNILSISLWCSSDDEGLFDTGLHLSPVVDAEDHHYVLKDTIDAAQNTLLITSHSITYLEKDIYDALRKAFYQRDVRIYIYYNDSLDRKAGIFLQSISTIQQRNIHAKVLIADENYITIGSQNWLDFDYADGYNRSFEIDGEESNMLPIKEQIWERIRHYGNIQHGNSRINNSPDMITNYCLDSMGKSQFSILSLLSSHESFFDDMCRTAERCVQIYSPFVTFYNAKQRLLDAINLIKPSVKIKIFIWSSEDSDKLFDFINQNNTLKKRIEVNMLPKNFHNKTIIRDEDLISEGSFNWLSSSLSEESQGHNLDCTLIYKGHRAKKMIKELTEDYNQD